MFLNVRAYSLAENDMFERLKQFGIVSRAEFILPNLGSLILGLAWGANRTLNLTSFIILLVLSFSIINLSSAIGAQINTYYDYELDTKDERKKQLVSAEESFGRGQLRLAFVVEFVCAFFLVSIFTVIQGKPVLFILWGLGIFLGWAYSATPIRLKSRSWLAPASLFLVLAVFPVLFAYFSFTATVEPLFLMSLAGLTLTVYGVIVPTETRDYFGDKAMHVETLTVHLGLVKASLLGIIFLSTGAILIFTSFLLKFIYDDNLILTLFLLAIPVAVLIVFRNFRKLYILSNRFVRNGEERSVADEIVTLSANNPRWIMLITQTYSFLSVLLLVSKFLL
jgi:4-hydroxybenzoate polyprenyltransferase